MTVGEYQTAVLAHLDAVVAIAGTCGFLVAICAGVLFIRGLAS